MKAPKSLLVDADIVIFAHELQIWDELKSRCKVGVPGTIVEEARFFRSLKSGKEGIHLQSQVNTGEIDRYDATADELLRAIEEFAPAFSDQLHDGEKEAMGLLVGGRFGFDGFCTGDVVAMEACGMLGIGDRTVSLEAVVQSLGVKKHVVGNMRGHLKITAGRRHVAIGKQRRITREYFRS